MCRQERRKSEGVEREERELQETAAAGWATEGSGKALSHSSYKRTPPTCRHLPKFRVPDR